LDLFDDFWLLDECDDPHRAATLGTRQGIGLIDLFDQPCPFGNAAQRSPISLAGSRSAQKAEEQLNPGGNAPFEFGLPGGRRHEVLAGLTLVERDAVDVDFLPARSPGPESRTG
jgi:hypothetical protein